MGRKHLYPPSVRHGIPHLERLPLGWIKTTFGEQLRVVERPISLKDNKTYQLISARRNRGGIVARETLRGDQILTAGQFKVEAGDFITSNRQIIHGACGIVPRELDGAIVSGEYTVMHARSGLHLPFFEHYTHSDYFQKSCFFASVGVDVEKMIFDVEQWLKLPFHLPPLPEQKRIATILGNVETALTHGRSAIAQRRCVRDNAVLTKIQALRVPLVALDAIITAIDAGKSPECPDRPASAGEVGVLKLSAVGTDGFLPAENKVVINPSLFENTAEVLPGDLLITRANTPELVGLTCIATESPVRLFLSDLILRIALDRSRIDAAFLDASLKIPSMRRQIRNLATGTSGSMRKINRDTIRSLRIKLPPLERQREIIDLAQKFNATLAVEERKLTSLERVKSELARRLLIGELRVKL